MIVVVAKSSKQGAFDVHAPEGFEDLDFFRIASHAAALKSAESLAEKLEALCGEQVSVSDEAGVVA